MGRSSSRAPALPSPTAEPPPTATRLSAPAWRACRRARSRGPRATGWVAPSRGGGGGGAGPPARRGPARPPRGGGAGPPPPPPEPPRAVPEPVEGAGPEDDPAGRRLV